MTYKLSRASQDPKPKPRRRRQTKAEGDREQTKPGRTKLMVIITALDAAGEGAYKVSIVFDPLGLLQRKGSYNEHRPVQTAVWYAQVMRVPSNAHSFLFFFSFSAHIAPLVVHLSASFSRFAF